MIRWAIRYAELGFAVFPCEPRGKAPLGRLAPNGSRSATHDPEQVRRLWRQAPDANVGVATGTSSRLLVVDLDGEEGLESFAGLTAAHGPPSSSSKRPVGSTVRTGSGWHLWLLAFDPVPNSASKLAPKVDTRGQGGYVLAPPSVHPNGAVYEWDEPLRTPLPKAADWLLELLARPEAPARAPAPRRELEGGPGSRYAIAAAVSAGERIVQAGQGARNDTLNSEAYSIAQLVAGGELEEALARELLEGAALEAGLTPREVARTLDSAFGAGQEAPRNAPTARIAA